MYHFNPFFSVLDICSSVEIEMFLTLKRLSETDISEGEMNIRPPKSRAYSVLAGLSIIQRNNFTGEDNSLHENIHRL